MTWILLSVSLLAWLLTARQLYGRWRGMGKVSYGECGKHGSAHYRDTFHDGYCCLDRRPLGDAAAAGWAMAAAAAWPLVLIAAVVRWRPAPTRRELAEARLRREQELAEIRLRHEQRIAELEKELLEGK